MTGNVKEVEKEGNISYNEKASFWTGRRTIAGNNEDGKSCSGLGRWAKGAGRVGL